MKSLIERTDMILEQILYCDLDTNVGIDKAKKIIRRLLKENHKESMLVAAYNVSKMSIDITNSDMGRIKSVILNS